MVAVTKPRFVAEIRQSGTFTIVVLGAALEALMVAKVKVWRCLELAEHAGLVIPPVIVQLLRVADEGLGQADKMLDRCLGLAERLRRRRKRWERAAETQMVLELEEVEERTMITV